MKPTFILVITAAILSASITVSGQGSKTTLDDYSTLKITELSYHPKDVIDGTDTISGKSYEFIEFKNTGTTDLDLSGFRIDSAISYTFPVNSILEAVKFYVVAAKPQYFYEAYGVLPSGNCDGFFNNGGDTILVFDSQNSLIITFIYSDESPWPETPDGDGTTLTSVDRNPTGDPSDYNYWTASSTLGGSPFSDDYKYNTSGLVTAKYGKRAFTVYPNPTTQYLVVEANSENSGKNIYCKLFNLNGSVVYENTFNTNTTIDFGTIELPGGVYFLKLETESDSQIRKIIFEP